MDCKKYMDAYDIQRRDASEVMEEFSDALATMHGVCIDIGCGPGNITKDLILPKLPNDSVIVGADVSNTMVEKARKIHKNEERLSFFKLNIEIDNLPSNEIAKYDHALSFYCLHWCQNIRHTLENVYKLLRPGGYSLIVFLSYNNGFDAYKRLQKNPRYEPYLEDTMKYIPPLHNSPNPRATMKKILQDVGFDVLHCSNREKSYVFENMEILKKHIIAVNPFLRRIPDDLKDEYINELTKEVARHKILFESKKDRSQGYSVLDRYRLLITYFRKPDDSSLLLVR